LYDELAVKPPNVLDDGKEGNYWSSNSKSEPFMIPSIWLADTEPNVDNFPRTSPYVFDYEPPVVELVSPENMTYVDGNITVFFSASEEIPRATYSLDGNEKVALSNGTIITGMSEGMHNLTVYAEDVFGDEGTSETIAFRVGPDPSTTPPLAEAYPLALIASVSVLVVIVIIGLLLYFRKRFKKSGIKRD
jgi:hypothetical protein